MKDRPPHRRHVLASVDVANERGTTVRAQVVSNWPGTRWWLTRSYVDPKTGKPDWLFADPVGTSSKTRAETWRERLAALAWQREKPS